MDIVVANPVFGGGLDMELLGVHGHFLEHLHSKFSLPWFGGYSGALVTDDRLGKLHWEFSVSCGRSGTLQMGC